MREKLNQLSLILNKIPSFAIAFSGGVDSSFLAHMAKTACKSQPIAFTAISCFLARQELKHATKMAKKLAIKHILVDVNLKKSADIIQNTSKRCYFCKKMIFTALKNKAEDMGLLNIIDGSNVDDLKDYRPGFKACHELGIISPLIDAGINKKDIRIQSKIMGLKTWNMPSQSCLATRIPYGDIITQEKLDRIQICEQFLFNLGIFGSRVRCHHDIARVECHPSDMDGLLQLKNKTRRDIVDCFKQNGFKYVCLDMEGYISGNMNR